MESSPMTVAEAPSSVRKLGTTVLGPKKAIPMPKKQKSIARHQKFRR
jgi:hypothetical protein